MLGMVLATILPCIVSFCIVEPPNAADAWRDFFVEFSKYDFPSIEHEDGFEMFQVVQYGMESCYYFRKRIN